MKKLVFSQKAFIVKDGKLLLVKKGEKDPFHPNEWEVPGGRLEFGETLEEHIKREVWEEVGIFVEPGRPFSMWSWFMTIGEDEVQAVAIGRVCKATAFELSTAHRAKDDYLSSIQWVDIDDLLQFDFIDEMMPTVEAFIELYRKGEIES